MLDEPSATTTAAVPLVMPGTLECDTRSLRICRLTLARYAHWDDVCAALAHEHRDVLLPVPSFAAVIFTAGGGKAARACACRNARVARMHDDEHLRDEHLPQLALALVSWLRATLRQHEHVPLADGG